MLKRLSSGWRRWLVLCVLGLVLLPASAQTNTNTGTVTLIIDGKTLELPVKGQANTNVTGTSQGPSTTSARRLSTPYRLLEQDALTFGLDDVRFLQPKFFGVPRWTYLASLIFILLAIGVSRLLDVIIGGWLKRWATRTSNRAGELLLNLVHGPIRVVSFVVLLHIGLQVFSWPAWLGLWISRGLQIVVACSITYMIVKLIDVLVDYWRQRAPARDDRMLNEHLLPVVSKTLKIFVLIVAVLMTCQHALGMDITTPLASLSIGGLALGLAAQDTVANLFGAVAVFVDKPFRVGDRIKLDAIDGVVETIGLRSTRVRSLDGFLITIPNKTMGNATITNITRRPNIKTEMNIGITYDTPAPKVKLALEILNHVYRKHPMTHDLIVGFNKFADSALNISVVHWWKTTDYRAYVEGMQELNLAIKQRFDAEGIEFAFPTQTLYVKQEPADGRLTELPAPSATMVLDNGTKRSS